MAIAKIKKLEIIGLQKDKEELLALLQKLGRVELIALKSSDTALTSPAVYVESDLLALEEAISYLATFQEKMGFLQGIVKFKPLVYEQQVQEVVTTFKYKDILQALSSLDNQLKVISHHKEKLIQEKQLLWPWQNLRIPLDELHEQKHWGVILGIFSSRNYQNLLHNIKKHKLNLFIDIVQQDKANMHLAILYLREEFEKLSILLKDCHFNFVTLTHHKCTAQERIFEINREILVLDNQTREIKNKIQALSKQQFKLMMVYDYFYNKNKTQQAEKNNLSQQQFTFILSGWIKQTDEKLLVQAVTKEFKDLAIFISEPKPDEEVPVVLENKEIFQPFEFITGIYGMPKYSEIDPTPYLAPFFFLYFGFCVSDVGYGLILALVSLFVLKRFRMGPQGTKFWRLILFCSISTMLIGALTGSWFGNLFDLLVQGNKIFSPLKKFKDAVVILDPLKEPTKLLGVALFLGIIQVWFGNIVAAIGNLKNKRYWNVIFDQLTMLTLLFGLTGLGLIFLGLLNKAHLDLFKSAAGLGAVALISTQGRTEKGWGAKLFYGIYNLYNALSGYLSDILSYSRLWALGLVTSVMANTINLISVQFSQILVSLLPFLNRIGSLKLLVSSLILITIFTAGHLVSFLMNLLGAFVHPLRLQLVEFFSKFFKSSGNALKAFKVETRYIDIG